MAKAMIIVGTALVVAANAWGMAANVGEPRSPLAVVAMARRDKARADAMAVYDRTLSDASAAYRGAQAGESKQQADELDKALRVAMEATDLDEANRIDAARRAARAAGEWQKSGLKKPTSPLALAAIDRGDKALADVRKIYELAVAEACAAYRKAEAQAEKQLIHELDAALKAAMKAGDLDDANRIDRVKKAADGAVVLRPAEPLRADTIILRSGTGTLPVEGTIISIDSIELVYASAPTDRTIHKPIDAVLQIKASEEPELTVAEQAYADGKWADAITKYQRALGFSTNDWAKHRATARLVDAIDRSQPFGAQVAAFVELAEFDPAKRKHARPEIKGVRVDELIAVMGNVGRAANSPDLRKESADVLKQFLASLYQAKLDAALADAAVFSASGDSRQIVFVCDASGSMLNKMATLKNEIQKAVVGLGPNQSFNIIFFQDEECVALDKTHLVIANAEGKRNAYKFLDDVTTSGTTDPVPALTLAFQQHPQLVYLLTDGDFDNNKAVKDAVTKLNADHKVRVNTIAFVNDQDTDTDFLVLLKQIAKDNDGHYKHVAKNKLNE